MRYLTVSSEAVLFILAVVVLGVPEARTATVRACLTGVYVVVMARDLWVARKQGVLKMTIGEFKRTVNDRPRRTMLNAAASILGTIAMIVSTP